MGRIESTIAVVADAGPLIHLDELGATVLLGDFAAIHVPEAVWAEVERHRPQALEVKGLVLVKVGSPVTLGRKLAHLATALALDRGEVEALCILESQPSLLFLTDDAAARLAATQLGYRVHGTIGVLLRAVRRGQLTPQEVEKLLQEIPLRSTLHIRLELLNKAIADLRRGTSHE